MAQQNQPIGTALNPSERLIAVLREKNPRRLMCWMDVGTGDKPVWELTSVALAPIPPPPGGNARSSIPTGRSSPSLPVPRSSNPPVARAPLPPMTHNRDPAKHYVSVSAKFAVHNMTIDQAARNLVNGMDVLYSMASWANKKEEKGEKLSDSLEVTRDMIEAYLLDREYVPAQKPKYGRDGRRRA